MSEYDKTNMSEETVLTPEEQRDQRFGKVQRRLLVIAALLLVSVINLSIRPNGGKQPVVLQPDYQLMETEPNAFPSNDNEEKFQTSEGGGAVALIYSDQVFYNLDTGRASLSFTNPSSSTASVILQIVIVTADGSEYLVAESGALSPGYSVERLDGDMDENVALVTGAYSGIMRLLFYNPDTGEKAIVNTEIPVTITVE